MGLDRTIGDFVAGLETRALPPEVVEKTRAKYIEAFERITGEKFEWK